MSYRNRGVKIPRPRRIKFADPQQGYYHVVSRALQKEFRFKAEEKTHLLSLMKWLSQIYFVRIATFTILDNHFHMVLQMMREDDISIEELRKRLEKYYEEGFNGLPPDIEQAFKEADLDDLYAHFSDISMFMWDLKLRFARWYNAKHAGYGHVWAERFTSVLLIGRHALRACMIYVELNSLRAGIVTRPESYKFSGLHCYLKGGRHASWLDAMILKEAVYPESDSGSGGESISDVITRYHQIIYHEGLNQQVSAENQVTSQIPKATISLSAKGVTTVFLSRIPAMTRGIFISDERICAELYQQYRIYFRAQHRTRKSKPIVPLDRANVNSQVPAYLHSLHSLPPPKKRTAQSATDLPGRSE